MAEGIRDWLVRLDLGEYAESFEKNDLDLSLVLDLNDADLKDLGVVSMGHRKKFLRAIRSMIEQSTNAEQLPDQSDVTADATSPTVAALTQVERRQLTVVFSDLVGSTALSQRLDPEDLHEIMRRYQDTIRSRVTSYGGFVAKFLGDGALAYFGWPQADEDQAERAVRAGLDIIREVQAIALPDGETLRARVGIATGEAVIGDIIGEAATEAHAVIGDTPNLAARLQEIAGPSELAIGPTTRRLVETSFELTNAGDKLLKGFNEPVAVCLVKQERRVDSRFEASHGTNLTPLIGRQSELNLLLDRWALACSGDGQMVMLSGEAGIGKSRLVQALQEHIAPGTYTLLHYQCSPFHTNSALYPVIQRFEWAAGFDANDGAEERLDKLECLLLPVDDDTQGLILLAALLSLPHEHRYGPLELSPQQQKNQTLDVLIKRLLALSLKQPVLFIVEDVHWIDPTTFELLEQTIPQISEAPVLMLVTHRPDWRANWTELFGNVVSLSLGRLGRFDVSKLVRSIAGNAAEDSLVGEIAARTDGIPLFVEEITKAALEAEGAGEQGYLQVPETLQSTLLARLDRLGDAKKLAQIGAVIGRTFSYSLLANVTLEPETNLLPALGRLVQSELLFQTGSPPNAVYTFKHALVQDAAYNSLLRNTRRELHARIAQAWSDGGGAEPEVLAYHFSEAGMIEPAIDYWSRAGRHAADRSSNTEAVSHFRKAIDLLDQLPDTQQRAGQELTLRASLGVPLSATLGPGAKDTFDNYERARELCLQFPDASEHFQVLWGLWRVNTALGRFAKSTDMADELMMMAKRSGSIDLLLEGHHAQWTTLSRVFDPRQCWHHTEQGIGLYEADKHHRHAFTISDHDAGICGRCFGAVSLWQLGQADRSLALSEDAVDLARRMSHPGSLALALAHAAWQLQLRGALDRVCERADETIAFATEQGLPQFVATASILKGWALCKLGQHEAGLQLIRHAMASGQAKGTGQTSAYFLHLLADGLLQAGQPQEGLKAIRQALDEMESDGMRAFEPEIHRIHAELLKCCDKIGSEEVETEFQKAIRLSHEKGAIALELRAAMGLARHWCRLGKAREAHEFLTKIYDRFTEGFDTPDLTEARQLLKELA